MFILALIPISLFLNPKTFLSHYECGRKIPLVNAIDFRPMIIDYNYTSTYYKYKRG